MSPLHLMAMTPRQIVYWHRVAFNWQAERDTEIASFVEARKMMRG